MKRKVWTYCWKCEAEIYSGPDCNYLKTRDGNFSLCPVCYSQFIDHNKEFIRPERSYKEELERTFCKALSILHEKLVDEEECIGWGPNDIPPVLIHEGRFYFDCPSCQEVLSLIKK